MVRFVLEFIFLISISQYFFGCTSPLKPVCTDIDWYEVGRQEGKVGSLPSDGPIEQKGCTGSKKAEQQTQYESGRNAGLAQYCNSKNGFEIGVSGESYFYVCPIELEDEILSGYHKGRKVYLLTSKANKLEKKIIGISSLLKDIKISAETKTQLHQELSQAKHDLVASEREIYKLRRSKL